MPKKTTESKQTYTMTLAKSNKLDSSALPANREGNFTDSQRQKLYFALVSKFSSSLLGVIFGISFLILGLFVFPKETLLTGWIKIIGSAIGFLIGVWWIFEGGKNFLKSWWPLLQDINGGKLVIEQGKIRKD